jgi:hypothetical protein
MAWLSLFLSKSLYKLKHEIANKTPTQSEPSVHSAPLQLEHPRGAVGDVQCPPSLLFSFWAIFFDFDLRARHSASAELLLFFFPVLTLDKLDILPLSHFLLFFADCFVGSSFSPSELSDPDLDFFYFIDSNVDCCFQS